MIYFDSAATTSPSDIAKNAFIEASEFYANPSSTHSAGIKANDYIRISREYIAKTLGAKPDEIYFMPSGTFANNTAIIGAAKAKMRKGKHIIISDSEHPSVYNTANELKKLGYEISLLSTKNGEINIDELKSLIRQDTVLISVMLANNETGALYDIKALSDTAKRINKDVLIHCDAVQGYLKTKFTVNSLGVDLLSVSSHKVHAFKGSGALYIRNGVKVEPIVFGGGQEKGICSGTEAVQSIYAFASSAKNIYEKLDKNIEYVNSLYSYASKEFSSIGCKVNTPVNSTGYVLSISLPKVKSEVMLNYLSGKGIYISAGSACSSHAKSNRVLEAFGLSKADADCTVRISFSEYNTAEEIDILCDTIKSGIDSLAKIK